jgi:hypothetical protein
MPCNIRRYQKTYPRKPLKGGRVAGHYGDTPVYYIGREQFVTNKRATGRTKDVADLEVLGEA